MSILKKIKNLISEVNQIKYDNADTRLLLGTIAAKSISSLTSLREAEFKVFSQFGDDGIIQYLIKNVSVNSQKFVEFGVETYQEANTRFLLLHDNWQGLIIDGSGTNIEYIKKDPMYWRHELTAVNSFITAENINQLLESNGFSGKIGLLSIDVDGNDYWIWKAITIADPDIVVVEYNSLFGDTRSITIPYNPAFVRTEAHYSNLYFGSSLCALCDLGASKGYSFVGCNQAGNNAYFVKDTVLGNMQTLSVKEGYVKARFREARSRDGSLTFSNEELRKYEIAGLPVINTRNGLEEPV